MKTFNTIALTSKGSFPVQIKVWKEGSFWKNETIVIIDEKIFKAEWNRYDSTCISSLEVGVYFGINKKVALKCDCKEAKNYIESVQMDLHQKNAKDQLEMKILEKLHNY